MTDRGGTLQRDVPGALGAHWDGRGCHFAVYSQHAEAVELCLFDAPHRHESARLRLPDCTDGVWHGYLPGVRPGQLYGYRVHGPYRPEDGHRFNANKLLLDPYARQIAGELRWHDALYGYRIGSRRADLSFDRRDSAVHVPKAVITDDYFDWGDDRPPRVPWSDTVIYEMHLRGFTRLREDLPEHDRGTFGALGHPRTIDYLRRLGITAVELLPVQAYVHDRELIERGLANYWGYNTLAWFAPHPAYLSDGTLGQIKWAVRELHAAGIEVILDIVFNHSCEGSELGPTLSLRGLDNASYYRLHADDPRHTVNDTGCGNTLDFTHPRTIQLAMDALRYWVSEFHVDGFRFDLGVTMGREAYGFDPGAGFFDALLQDPLLARTKLISEPWDIGPGGYQLGNHPPGIAEWNGRYRDDLRGYWRGDDGMRGALAARLQGSADIFEHRRRLPYASVNFVTAHDGFTLADLVAYEHKRNEANGEDGRDGTDDNISCGWGQDGPTDDPAILDLRDRVRRSQLATLLFALGTPMLLAGDEFGQTQNGNNNVYCQDNDTAWLQWRLLDAPRGAGMRDFVARLLSLRREHALLRCRDFLHGRDIGNSGLPDLSWFDENGKRLTSADWRNDIAHLLAVRRGAARSDGGVDLVLLLFNGDRAAHRFSLPQPAAAYRCLIDTADPDAGERAVEDPSCEVAAHSVVLLAGQLEARQRDDAGGADAPTDEDSNDSADGVHD
ncbi:MAG: glycogen debranching protein GlgX [Pseudomonadota bacterium]|nr:glycogen debranching protein GlgX [Pseudomonadota bacterium]